MALSDQFLTMALNDAKAYSSTSIADSVTEKAEKLINTKSAMIKDAFGNSVVATGVDNKLESFNTYGFNNDTLNWPLWLALYNDSWVFRRAIDKPAQDMVSCGIHLNGQSDFTEIYKDYNMYKPELTAILQWGALFGGSVGIMMFDTMNDEDMGKPIDKKKLKGAHMRIYVTDRWYGCSPSTETVSNIRNLDFGKPMYYDIQFADGHTVKVHHTFVLRYEHRIAPQLVKNGQLQGWGYAEGAHVLNELSRDDQLKASITTLINKANIEVVKMSGMRGVFMGADKGNEDQLRKRLEMVTWGRNYNSLTFLDKDDDYQTHDIGALSGLSQLLETNMWLVAAALEMQGVLFGELKGGLSQDSDSFKRYATTIKNRCESYFKPIVQKLLIVEYLMHDIKEKVDFEFNSVIQEELNNNKADSISKFFETLQKLTGDQIISKYQAAMSMQEFLQKGIINITFTPENMEKLKLQEEMETLDVYKAAGRDVTKPDMGEAQFPNGVEPGADLPDKLDYLKPDSTQNASLENIVGEMNEAPNTEPSMEAIPNEQQ